METTILEGSAEFVRNTQAALALLQRFDPQRAALVLAHIQTVTGLNRREFWRLGRTTLYGRDWQALTQPVDYAWVDRRQRHCFVAPSVWQVAPGDDAALRRYAAVLVHEAAHVYLDTEDEQACNAEMKATQALLIETEARRRGQTRETHPISVQ
ncbi:MAG TPA: hypothetical protein VGP33_15430 [Chloroflexota bacterium]|jgi:hypothetical protein|nr:hypothetical protein [Chloroflexota bacterium]